MDRDFLVVDQRDRSKGPAIFWKRNGGLVWFGLVVVCFSSDGATSVESNKRKGYRVYGPSPTS